MMSGFQPDLVVFRGVRAFDPAIPLDALVDVLVEKGRIVRLGPNACADLCASPHALIFGGAGMWLLPGLVDLHTHLREPGQEYKEDIESGLQAAAAGGFAHVCAMPNTRPVNDTRAISELMLSRARAVGGPALHPVSAITVGLEGKELVEMAEQKEAGCVAVSDDGKCVMSSAVMRHALEYARNFELPVIQHAEDHSLTQGSQMHEGLTSTRLGLTGWPRAAEDIIVARDVILAELTGAHYHVAHVSSLGAVRIVREAKARGVTVTAEVTPHHLLLTDSMLHTYDPLLKVAPPVREPEDTAALLQALADGTIDCIATDHAPHSLLEKDCEYAAASPGMIGLETCLPLMMSLVREGKLTLGRMIDALTKAPSRIINIPCPQLREGEVANLTLIDPEARYVLESSSLHSKSKNTPFLGKEMQGRVECSMAGGRLSYVRDDLHTSRQAGTT